MGFKISNLIASEIVRNEDIGARVSAIEKWVAVADICRCLHNYNAVLEITSSMNRSAIFRLKKTWLKVSKQVGGWAAGNHRGLGPGRAAAGSPGRWTLGSRRCMKDRVRPAPPGTRDPLLHHLAPGGRPTGGARGPGRP